MDIRTERRGTRQRRAVEKVVGGLEEFRSAQEIHELLRHGGDSVGLATVYRQLQTLVDEGVVDTVRADDGELRYRTCSESHHHHLVCRSCGTVVELESAAVERWARAAAAGHGFTDTAHTVELRGLCPRCS